ncbi:cold-shock protein [Parendozoicomonas haliclonae]|uniref:Cold shock-like protein CspD n=1 Tax=Parendozoicomonas haliclonae TaxID=1960125 RepID=A0A1X7AKM9_9GAMM|nr:cold shock domain-containing protein [Parendozoicomonas haliclonae]SMA47911.1 Cold shock-like protein CspD [Parendozoicomonas haliclonae]
MPTGKVKWFNNAKGYGFILPGEEGNGEDLFVHYSSITMDGYKTLKAGQQVTYEIIQGPKGLHAINITILPEDGASEALEAAPVASAEYSES